jgi:hypothetical protein
MFDRISNGWQLAKQSFDVLRLDKELLFFPLMSGIACALVLASFLLPLWLTNSLQVALDEGGELAANPLAWIVVFAFYFVNFFVIVFFNAALVACAIIRFQGGDPTISDGLSAATARLPQIVGWALVSATVGIVLKMIESWSEKFGEIAAALLGTAWAAATYFVVPVLVIEKVGPIDAVKRSASVLKRAWGEALSARFGIGFIVFLATLCAFVPTILGALSGTAALAIAGIAVTVISLIVIALVSSAVKAILVSALYLYAAEGTAPEQFDQSLLENAFGRK